MTAIELMVALLLGIFTHMTYYEQVYSDSMVDDFILNWSMKPIVEIIATDDQNCPHPFEPLITDKWQGTTKGCYCPSAEKVESGKCDDMMDNLLDFF
jgi:hypothetical protein